jgi:hypothetical protein
MLETMIHITWRGSATITTGYLAGGVVSLSNAIIPGQRKESADRFSTNVLPVIRDFREVASNRSEASLGRWRRVASRQRAEAHGRQCK